MVPRRDRVQRRLRDPPAARRTGRPQSRLAGADAAHPRREPDQHLRRGERLERLPAERAHRRPEPPRDRADPADPDPRAALSALGAQAPAAEAARRPDRLSIAGRAGHALAQRHARPRRRGARAADPVPAPDLLARGRPAARDRRPAGRVRGLPAPALLRRGRPLAPADGRPLDDGALRRLRLRPAGAAPAPALWARLQQLLGLLRVRHRQDELGAALLLRRAARRGRHRRHGAFRRLPLVPLRPARRGAAARAGTRDGGRPPGGAAAAPGVGDDRRARRDDGRERLLPDHVVPLLLRLRDAAAGRSRGVLPAYGLQDLVKIAVLTTSYPRWEGDPAGNFVADAVEQLRARGVEVEVVSPASFRHFGIAYGSGVVGNLKRQPWRAALVPAMLASFARAARKAARDADLVHAHWLSAGVVALATGRPFVVQLWGTDVELARRAPALARRGVAPGPAGVRGARGGGGLAAAARGARGARGSGGARGPGRGGGPAQPPGGPFVGRLSAGEG